MALKLIKIYLQEAGCGHKGRRVTLSVDNLVQSDNVTQETGENIINKILLKKILLDFEYISLIKAIRA